MANKRVQINSFCGGTSKLVDSAFLGFEESVNMYPETIQATDSYSQKFLKSVEGFSQIVSKDEVMSWTDGAELSNFYVASRGPSGGTHAAEQVIYFVYGSVLYRLYKDNSVVPVVRFAKTREAGSQVDSPFTFNDEVTFCETSGDPAYLIVCGGGRMFPVSMDAEDYTGTLPIYAPSVYPMVNPDAYSHEGKIYAKSAVSFNFRIFTFDKGSDYIYWSELNKPDGVNDNRAFQKQLTKYAYTKNDGTSVTYDDNVYYPPAYGTYVEGSLTKKTEWMGALNNVKVDFRADNIVNIAATDSNIFVFGSRSYQIFEWQNNETLPIVTYNKVGSVGLAGEKALAAFDNRIYFIGSGDKGSNSVWVVSASGIEKISTTAIDQKLASLDRSKGRCMIYNHKGHAFLVVTFSKNVGNCTYAYDITEGVWHTKGTMDANGDLNCWSMAYSANANGLSVFGRGDQFGIYVMDSNSFTDVDGLPILRSRTTGIKFENLDDVIIRSLELVTDNGAGKDLILDPRVMLQVSTDGGFTWSSEKWVKSGKVGQRNFRTLWRDLGKGSRIAFKVKVTDGAPFNIASAFLEYAPLKNRIG